MQYSEIKDKIFDLLHQFDAMNERPAEFILVHPDEAIVIANNADDHRIHFEPSKDRWGRFYFRFYKPVRIIRSIDIDPGEILIG
jgi:hypothetical protein